MQVVVITGSTRGIGLGLAGEMLTRGASVVVSGRGEESVAHAVEELAEAHGERVTGVACDVTDPGQVQGLWDGAVARFGRVDVWINNAGMANTLGGLGELEAGELEAVIGTNVTGTLLGCRVAIRGMTEQGGGALWNMEGLGSDGRKVPGLAPYGTTKAAVTYLTDALIKEQKGTVVRVGAIRPGMVLTDMLLGQLERMEEGERARLVKIYNILADRVETVTPWIAGRVLGADRHGARVVWLSGWKVMWRFLTAGVLKRDVMSRG